MSEVVDPRSKFVFEKNVPVPPRTGNGQGPQTGSKYPYQYMEVGESHLTPGPIDKVTHTRLISAVSGARSGKYRHRRYTYRMTDEEFRVWRDNDVASKK